jgi:hypothetical protein
MADPPCRAATDVTGVVNDCLAPARSRPDEARLLQRGDLQGAADEHCLWDLEMFQHRGVAASRGDFVKNRRHGFCLPLPAGRMGTAGGPLKVLQLDCCHNFSS